MNDTATNDWNDANQRYLAIALEWLRLRLKKQAQKWETPTSSKPAPQAEPAVQAQKQGFLRRSPVETPPAKPALLPAPGSSSTGLDAQIAQKAADMETAESQMKPPPALITLSNLLGLSRFERDALFLCIAMELDPDIAALCALAQNEMSRAYPTFALVFTLFDEPHWDILSPERPLRYLRLIEINQPGAQALTTSTLRADERIVNYVKGLGYLDDRLVALMVPLERDEISTELPLSQQATVEEAVRYWQQVSASSPSSLPIIQLVGPDTSSKLLVASHVAARFNRYLCRMPVETLPSHAADLETLARLWQRESILLPLALYLDAQEVNGNVSGEGQMLPLNRFLAHCTGFLFVATREVWPRLGQSNLVQDVARPTPSEQQAAWTAALGAAAPDSPGLLAGQFDLNLATIKRIARMAMNEAVSDKVSLPDRLWDICRMSARPRLDTLAQRLEPKMEWDDLVLPDEEMKLLHQIADQVGQRSKVYEDWGFAHKMNRGLGISALFAGESGTGKTMAAEVLANHLRLNLYRIDLSAVVSKYIGETEKNLRRLFDAAEDGGAILFFDEADALFGKRSEVKDSHDRYANIEINYLLQRMETYRGLAILATNMKSALDPAFTRRIRFIVNFPFPGQAERKRIWQQVFPKGVPTDSLDYERLATFKLTGGSIHNIALNAAFLAAQKGEPVTMPLVLMAARSEFRKQERLVNEADFRWQVLQGARA